MKKMLGVLNGKPTLSPPLWLMRQAGRYLPEYRETRAKAGSFLNLVYNPELAAEVTLQPIRRYGFDAAILFSDILVIPQALGSSLVFTEGEGPKLSAVQGPVDLAKLKPVGDAPLWAPILETVARIKTQLMGEDFHDCTLIGFAGSPWTICCYMVQGDAHDHDFKIVMHLADTNPAFLDALMDMVTNATIAYLLGQIDSGAEVIQLFDSWAGVITDEAIFEKYVIIPTQKIIHALRSHHPHIPVIGFPRNVGQMRAAKYARLCKLNALSCDQGMDLTWLRDELDGRSVLQGNLNPDYLRTGGDVLDREIDRILVKMSGRPHIFNLGHGITPDVNPAHVGQLAKRIREHHG